MSLERPRRITIPFLLDVVFVSSAEQIRRIEASGGVDRLHSRPTASLPGWVRFFFGATKFHDPERDLWFCPMESSSDPSYRPRREYLAAKASLGYDPGDVGRIAGLLAGGAGDDELAHAMVQVVNRRFFGEEVPERISRAAGRTLQGLGEAALPWKYARAKRARREVMAHCRARLPAGVHLLDVGHNIGEVVQTTARALRILHRNPGVPVESLFTANPLTPQVPRIAAASTTFGGLLRRPTRPGRTVVIYRIGDAAASTGDLDFTFGAGSGDRACVFRDFFIGFMRDLQAELRQRGG